MGTNKQELVYSLTYVLELEGLSRSLKYQNRFFPNSCLFEETESYVNKAINNEASPLTKVVISLEQPLYRARIKYKHVSKYITDYDYYENRVKELGKPDKQFYGFSAQESLAPPPDNVTSGRLNPQYIQVLYTSNRPYTALAEVRPNINSHVSIATIKAKTSLNILRINSNIKFSDDEDDVFLYCINRLFSTPLDGTFEDYLPVQFIAGYIKSTKKFDGIEFQSSLDTKGQNIVIFDQSKCEAVCSELYLVKGIDYQADCLAPYKSAKLSSKD